MNEKDKCFGCELLETVDHCYIRHHNRIDDCPCINCLVKNMCSMACKEWHDLEHFCVCLSRYNEENIENF
jgi:hypothetical protein